MSSDIEYRQLVQAASLEDVASLPCVVAAVPHDGDRRSIFIPSGASGVMAKAGVDALSEEILAFIDTHPSNKPWKVISTKIVLLCS